ncbi:hypothetical protein BJ138DRAFT_1188251 [Hygrophoropsis aurantiaca]|uniref:Uncharacterized protein n=1 Tax=Hygrophoropsis aurantiaca TaxID=72124 RepID=A0ACB7ZT97_9AGAM|nr:hypothetical protein BJ138DRAFT_1188251 [Hygrophoropsis aurantiaca]
MLAMAATPSEGVEREWSHINPVAMSTRLMGPGAHHDTLDDHWGAWNWRKTVGLGQHLLKKMREALPMKAKHRALHKALTTTFPAETITEWRATIDQWQEDPTQPSPYQEAVVNVTLSSVLKKLEAEERAFSSTQSNSAITHETTATSFLAMGLELEQQQRNIRAKAKEIKGDSNTIKKQSLDEQRTTLASRIETWQSIQVLYMPGIAHVRQMCPTRTNALVDDERVKKSEDIMLHLPSTLPISIRATGCVEGLLEKEKQLRLAEAEDTLGALRRQLLITTGVFNFKKTHISGTGQKPNTRARAMLTRLMDKARNHADRYRAARRALVALDPEGDWKAMLKVLHTEDIRGPRRTEDEASEGNREISWIWVSGRQRDTRMGTDEIAEGLRIEWAKSDARAQRWDEEVELLNEEMRRVLGQSLAIDRKFNSSSVSMISPMIGLIVRSSEYKSSSSEQLG